MVMVAPSYSDTALEPGIVKIDDSKPLLQQLNYATYREQIVSLIDKNCDNDPSYFNYRE